MHRTMHIMVVDNEELVARSVVGMLQTHGYKAEAYYSGGSALKALQSGGDDFDLIIADINMPGMDGYTFIEKLRGAGFSDKKVLVLTGYGSIDGAVKAIKMGASGYFEKDRDPELLLFEIQKISESICLKEKMAELERRVSLSDGGWYLFSSKNDKVHKVFDLALQIAPRDVSVFISGESGTGKDILARYIHQKSNRSRKRFLSVNCSAIPDSLFESEMFGHVKGAFTGAVADRKGFFEQVHGGTLMLDEIGEMPVSNQAKLLKVLEEKTYAAVGGSASKTADCRIIAATNRNLQDMIKSGSLRSDLYFRINTVELHLPPLRERREDILDLVEMYLEFFNKKYQTSTTRIDKEARAFLLSYEWPGNIRQLGQVVERCVLFSKDGGIDKEVLLYQGITMNDDSKALTGDNLEKQYKHAKRDFDRVYFSNALQLTNYSISEVARMSGMNRAYIYQKIKDLGLSQTKLNG
jgi:DNA-binding NtrC family response regulator